MLKLGYKASAEQFGPRELLDFSRYAEEVGFDSVFISDHFQPWRHAGGHAPYSLAWLGALGAMTERIVMGTSVLTPTFRYAPAIVAQAFGTLGVLFPKRLILGLGTGEAMNETPSSGMVWPEQKERTARFRESVDLIERLWKEERVSFAGQYYKTEKATIYDRPNEPVPIYIAASGPVIAKFAGEKAQGFICTSGKDMKLYNETLLPNVEAGLAKAGRSSGLIDRMIEMKVSFDTDRDRALSDTHYWGALALSPEEKVNVEDPIEMERLSDALPIERTAKRWIVSADPEEQVEKIRPYIELGFNHLVFHAPGPGSAALPASVCRASAASASANVSAETLRSGNRSPPKILQNGDSALGVKHKRFCLRLQPRLPGDRLFHFRITLPQMRGEYSQVTRRCTYVRSRVLCGQIPAHLMVGIVVDHDLIGVQSQSLQNPKSYGATLKKKPPNPNRIGPPPDRCQTWLRPNQSCRWSPVYPGCTRWIARSQYAAGKVAAMFALRVVVMVASVISVRRHTDPVELHVRQ